MTFAKIMYIILGTILAFRFVYTLDFNKSPKATFFNIACYFCYICSIPIFW